MGANSDGGRGPQLLIIGISGLSYLLFQFYRCPNHVGVLLALSLSLLDLVNDGPLLEEYKNQVTLIAVFFFQENDTLQVNNTMNEFVPPTPKVCKCNSICLWVY